MNSNYLFDRDFLKELDKQNNKEIFAKIVTLTFDESPIEEITGRVTSGNINIDGKSSVRRTCSLSMVADNIDLTDFEWGLNTKFQLYIGVRNLTSKEYDDIIWFKQGIYLFTNFSTSYSTSSFEISLSGTDKMCLLNGAIGGKIPSLTWVFDSYESIDAMGNLTTEKYRIYDIIRDTVHVFGKEPFHNIVINDLDIDGVELLEYRGSDDMYFFFLKDSDAMVTNIAFGGKITDKYLDENNNPINIENPLLMVYDLRIDMFADSLLPPTVVHTKNSSTRYTVGRVTYGQLAGYRMHDLTYPSDLIGNVGDDVVKAVLDPICSMLGQYEYFYDLDGRFIFQKKHNYVQDVYSNVEFNVIDGTFYEDSAAYTSALSYSFDDCTLINSVSNSPDLSNIKNDFSIWGTRRGSNGIDIPIHLRYAIDEKPLYYKTIKGDIYISHELKEMLDQGQDPYSDGPVDKGFVSQDSFKAYKLPSFLTSDWWELEDWGNYYNYLTGGWPAQSLTMDTYWSAYTTLDLELFSTYINGKLPSITWNIRRPIYMLTINSNNQISYVDYNPPLGASFDAKYKCNFSYPDLIQKKRNNGDITFIYKPMLPNSLLSSAVLNKLDKSKMQCWDWREILYQMALDYYNHNHEENFLAQVAANNPGVYPTGVTNYEQYYVDIMGFWRELYRPDILAFEMGGTTPNMEIGTVYAWNPTTKTYEHIAFDDYTEIKPITKDTPTVYYLDDNGDYIQYYYHNGESLYRKEDITALEKMSTSAFYYTKSGSNYVQTVNAGVNGFSAGQKYYVDKGYQQAQNFYIPANNTVYYKRDANGNYQIAFTIYANINYYKDSAKKSKTSFFARGNTYYGSNNTSFKLEMGVTYYIAKGFVEVLDLTKYKTTDYFAYSGMEKDYSINGSYVGIQNMKLKPGKKYSCYFKIDSKNYNFEKYNYYAITATRNNNAVDMQKRKYLSEFKSGNTYYVKEDTHKKCAYPYSQYDPRKQEIYEVIGYNFYLTEDKVLQDAKTYYTVKNEWHPYNYYVLKQDYIGQSVYASNNYNPFTGWTLDLEAPDCLNFWFDFLDAKTSELGKYSVRNIGQRPHFVNESDVTAIYHRDAPEILFIRDEWDAFVQPAYTHIQTSNYYLSNFTVSSQKNSAMDLLQEFLYEYTYGNEQISLNTIPIYYLEPNTRIQVIDKESNINGEYIVSAISLSLNYDSMMSISAYRAVERIF